MILAEQTIHERRAENLAAIRSPGSLMLAAGTPIAVLASFMFYDHPITDTPVLLTYLHGAFSGTVQ